LRRPEEVAKTRGLSISQVLPYKAPEPEEEESAAVAPEAPAPQETQDDEGSDNSGS
jgi:hypothetical protein